MTGQSYVTGAATIVPVRDVEMSVAFYVGVLGFEPGFVSAERDVALVRRGGAAVQVVRTDDAGALAATATNISIYLYVRGLDALFALLRPALDGLPPGRVRAPFDQPYGMREFHVKDPDGCLLLFGEER